MTFDLAAYLRDCSCGDRLDTPVGDCKLHGPWDDRGKPGVVETDPFDVERDQHYRSFGNSEADRPVGGWPQEKWGRR